MKCVYLALYYDPETYSSPHLLEDKLRLSKKAGLENVIISPNPIREVSEEFKEAHKHDDIQEVENATHVSLVCKPYDEVGIKNRLLRAFRFSKRCAKYLSNLDDIGVVVLPSNPPVFLQNAVLRLSKKKGFKTIFCIHDVYPYSMFSEDSSMGKLLKPYFSKILKRCDFDVVLSEDMADSIERLGAPRNKIEVIHAWSYKKEDIGEKRKEELKQIVGYDPGKINVFYIGNLGKQQNVESIVACAKKSLEKGDPIVFHFVGSGSNEGLLDATKDMPNVVYSKRVNKQEAAYLYGLSDVNLVTLMPDIIKYAYPSKTPLVLEAGKPIVAMVDESHYSGQLSEECGAIIVKPNDVDRLLEAIKEASERKGIIAKDTRAEALEKWYSLFTRIRDGIQKEDR